MRNDLTYNIIGCAMKVHTTIGNGFPEVIYQRCLAIELDKAQIEYKREVEHPVFYDGIEVGKRRADFVVANSISVELKALSNIADINLAQAKNYVVAFDFKLGLLINFGALSLQHKLIFNPKYKLSDDEIYNVGKNSV